MGNGALCCSLICTYVPSEIATLSPTWEFQLCLKYYKLASWTTMWL